MSESIQLDVDDGDVGAEARLAPDLFGVGDHLRADRLIVVVAEARPITGAALGQHGVSGPNQQLHANGQQPDAILVLLYLAGGSNDHVDLLAARPRR